VKRGGPLERRTRLARGAPLARGASTLARSALDRRTRLAARSVRKLAAAGEEARVRSAVFVRDGHRCQFPPVTGAPPCFGPLTFHHLRKASAGGAYSEANGLTLCAFHNGWVEDNPTDAFLLGLVLR
jgi:hypothetical protein